MIDHVRANILSGAWSDHTPLPSERTLSEQFGVSRMTARRALQAVETEGLAYSSERRGRFVAPKRMIYDISSGGGFFADADQRDLGLEVEVVFKRKERAGAKSAQKLAIAENDDVFTFLRLFRVEGNPVFIEQKSVSAEHFPGFLDQDLSSSTNTLMANEYRRVAKATDIVFRMRALDQDEANHLCVPTYNVGIELVRTDIDENEVPFCITEQVWRGEFAEVRAYALLDRRN